MVAIEIREDQIEQCRQMFETERDKLVDLAQAGKLVKRKRRRRAAELDDDVPF